MHAQCRKLRQFQSTPPVREVTPHARPVQKAASISIHTSRAGGDIICISDIRRCAISIHTSRAGGDQKIRLKFTIPTKFQSTPPVREVTDFQIS